MKEQLIKFKTAKLAKSKGFANNSKLVESDISTPYVYNDSGLLCNNENNYIDEHDIAAPTQSLLQKWLREIHGIHIVLIPTVTTSWTFKTVTVLSKRDNDVLLGLKSVSEVPPYKEVSGYDFLTYEEALEFGLQEALKLI